MKDKVFKIFYFHGMGGGADSRIPNILKEYFSKALYLKDGIEYRVEVDIFTYSFDVQIATKQFEAYFKHNIVNLVIGESLGSLHAIRQKDIPHILISPALNTYKYFYYLAFLSRISLFHKLFNNIWKAKEGDRQSLDFSYSNLRQYKEHYRLAMANSTKAGSRDVFYAFFGKNDHYMKYGIVSVKHFESNFSQNYTMYEGSHFTENKYVYSLIIPKILELIGLN